MTEITLGHRTFKTKRAAATVIRSLLHDSELHKELVGDDADLISALYARHPRRRRESPESYHVAINTFHGALARGFHAIFADGSHDAFSYRPCLTPEAATPSLTAAMRGVIMISQREILREVYWKIRPSPARCWKCREFVPIELAHVHHLHPKFSDIADHFVSLIGLPEITSGTIGDVLVDAVMCRRWRAFHDSVAQRVVACAKCNAEDEYLERSAANP